MTKLFSIVILNFLAAAAIAGEMFASIPSVVDPNEAYVIYSHGLIVEGEDPRPLHPRWGAYEFAEIKQALAEGGEYNVIAHHRPADIDVETHVLRLETWVRRLVERGVKPHRITLVGFSRGGEITARTSSKLKPMTVNTVLLATCWERGVKDEPLISFSGRFLSIYETSDVALSCSAIAERSDALLVFDELAISTGDRHGAFFKPLSQWIDPLVTWIEQ